jgi:putative transposase
LHTLIANGSPWRNGFIERSHRTDNEEFFQRYRFASSEESRYYFRLWEEYYNHARPHQGLGNHTPAHRFALDYPFHAAHRNLT